MDKIEIDTTENYKWFLYDSTIINETYGKYRGDNLLEALMEERKKERKSNITGTRYYDTLES